MLEYWNIGILGYGKTVEGPQGSQPHHSTIPSFHYSSKSLFSLVLVVLCFLLLPAQGAIKTYSIRLPVTAVVTEKDDSGKTWRRNGVMPVTYVSGVNQMKACLAGQGWAVKQIIPLGRKNDRTLINFEKGSQKITVMVWRIDLAKTGFSWGIIE